MLTLSFKVWSPLPSIPPHPSSLSNFSSVDAAKRYRKHAWGMFCENEGVRFGWFGSEMMTQPQTQIPTTHHVLLPASCGMLKPKLLNS